MTRIETPVDPLTELAFEIERFEWTAADRLEVSGRWLGVRGQRFVRPTLHLRVDGRRRRLIAVLDHKPWAADTDHLWTAAFAWRGDRGEVTAARLEVSTDIVLDLPAPGAELPPDPLTPRPRPKRPTPPRRPAAEPPPAAATGERPAPAAAVEPTLGAAAGEPPSPAAADTAPRSPQADTAPPSPPAAAADTAPPSPPAAAEPPPAADTAPPSPPATAEPPPAADTAPPLPHAAAEPPPHAAADTGPPSLPAAAEPLPAAAAEATPPAAPVSPTLDASRSAGAPDSSTAQDVPIAEIDPPVIPAHASATVTAEIAALALERRLVEERAEREVLARDLAAARQRIEVLSSHHESAVARAEEIVDLEGQLAVANARADAAQAHVARLERELARVTAAEAAPLAPRAPRRHEEAEWDARTKITAFVAVAVALLVVLIIVISIV